MFHIGKATIQYNISCIPYVGFSVKNSCESSNSIFSVIKTKCKRVTKLA